MNLKDFQNNNKDNPKVAIFPKQSIILKPQRKLDKSMMNDFNHSLLVDDELVHVGYAEEREDLFIIGQWGL